ncbi:MAG: hypothetical protein IPO39_07360 [Bacteroidetes bacterium]|nr:hypothetical protein [Bacteroidota bacterium]
MRGNISFGDGIYKSTDAGRSWKHSGLENHMPLQVYWFILQIRILFMLPHGKIFGTNPERGLYKSIDGGKHGKEYCIKMTVPDASVLPLIRRIHEHFMLPSGNPVEIPGR